MSTTLVRKPVRIAAARGPQTRQLGVSAHHTDALWNATVAAVGSSGIGNFNTTVNAPPDRPPPPIADEIVDDIRDMVHLINSGLRSNISAHSSQARPEKSLGILYGRIVNEDGSQPHILPLEFTTIGVNAHNVSYNVSYNHHAGITERRDPVASPTPSPSEKPLRNTVARTRRPGPAHETRAVFLKSLLFLHLSREAICSGNEPLRHCWGGGEEGLGGARAREMASSSS